MTDHTQSPATGNWAPLFVALIKNMSPAHLRAVRDAINARLQEDEHFETMTGVLHDQRHNPVTSQERLPRVGVIGAQTVGNGSGWSEPRSLDDWRPPGQAIIDKMTGG